VAAAGVEVEIEQTWFVCGYLMSGSCLARSASLSVSRWHGCTDWSEMTRTKMKSKYVLRSVKLL